MSYIQHPYLSGKVIRDSNPLFRYFPPIPAEVHASWLEKELNLSAPGWVMDPFGTSPFLSLQLAQKGYRVLTSCNNPIVIFMMRILAKAPGAMAFKGALSELSKIRRGDEWLDQHLNNLYNTECPVCNQTANALLYIWKKGDIVPDSCSYHCGHCGANGEKQCDQKDYKILSQIGSAKLHRARAIQRVTEIHSKIEQDVEQILENYLPRPLYFITTLINKIEGGSIPEERKELLYALILTVCDQGNTLWSHPTVRAQPKQLITPPSFKEFNLWNALESSIDLWVGQETAVKIFNFPETPGTEGGLCLFSNRLRSIESLPVSITPKAAICIFPRPTQAFWTLSALWSGWLWGKDGAAPLISSFERKRYDWSWLDNALVSILSHLSHLLKPDTPVFGMLSEMDPGFIFSSIHAASISGFKLNASALNEDDELIQLWWKNNRDIRPGNQDLISELQNSITSYLSQTAEPVSYIKLFTNTLLDTTFNQSINSLKPGNNVSLLKRFQSEFENCISSDQSITRFPVDNPNLESCMWGLKFPPEVMSLSDHVEIEVVNFLNRSPLQVFSRIEDHIFEHFPGLATPSREFINTCLDSYAEEVTALPGFPGKWILHTRENPAKRKVDIQEIIKALTVIGTRIGFHIADQNPLSWINQNGDAEYMFYIMASSIISRYVYAPGKPALHRMIVLPGSRSKLLSFKLQNNLNLSRLVEEGNWRFIKFRHMRELTQKNHLSPALWLDLIKLDQPMWEDAVQLNIFPDNSM